MALTGVPPGHDADSLRSGVADDPQLVRLAAPGSCEAVQDRHRGVARRRHRQRDPAAADLGRLTRRASGAASTALIRAFRWRTRLLRRLSPRCRRPPPKCQHGRGHGGRRSIAALRVRRCRPAAAAALDVPAGSGRSRPAPRPAAGAAAPRRPRRASRDAVSPSSATSTAHDVALGHVPGEPGPLDLGERVQRVGAGQGVRSVHRSSRALTTATPEAVAQPDQPVAHPGLDGRQRGVELLRHLAVACSRRSRPA